MGHAQRRLNAEQTRRVCFVSGTRAEFGLMIPTLRAIQAHPRLKLQLVLTGMHLDAAHGRSADTIEKEWKIDATVSWRPAKGPAQTAARMGAAIARLAEIFARLQSDVVLVVGDRVEAFAAAAAAGVSQIALAHVHGGDKALGQVDDSLRHAITKLAHIHFPATEQSARRIERLGEDRWCIHRVGAPGLDQIKQQAAPWATMKQQWPELRRRRYALLVLHPSDVDERLEYERAKMLADLTAKVFGQVVIIGSNNDPGSAGIRRRWEELDGSLPFIMVPTAPRPLYLGLMRNAVALVGNSSSGIIEAASFGTPVLDIGPRQAGREHSGNLTHVEWSAAAIRRAMVRLHNGGRPIRYRGANVYGGAAGRRIARILANTTIDWRLLRKLICY